MPSTRSTAPAERAGMALALLAAAFTLATVAWTILRAGTGAPGYAQEGPMRELLVVALAGLAIAAPVVRRRVTPAWRATLVRMVPMTTIAGLLGHAVASIVNPLTGPGAILAPDLGHVLHPEHPGGTLWFLFLWGAPLIGLAARSLYPWEVWTKLACGWIASYYAGVGVFDLATRVVEEGGGRLDAAVFALFFATLGVGSIALVFAWRERRGPERPT